MSRGNDADIQRMARIVHGESKGEPMQGQSAVAHTILNRVNHSGYPNSISEVADQRYGGNRHQFETLDLPGHNASWENDRRNNTVEYQNAVRAASDAASGRSRDPTNGATCFASNDPNPATSSNQYWRAVDKVKIGNQYFARQVPK